MVPPLLSESMIKETMPGGQFAENLLSEMRFMGREKIKANSRNLLESLELVKPSHQLFECATLLIDAYKQD